MITGSRPRRVYESYLLPSVLTMLLGLFLLFRSLLFHPPANTLWASDYDTPLIYWTASWGYHAIIEQGSPVDFFHANSFYPQPYSLAYSDSLLGMQVFYLPLRLLVSEPLSALYLALAATIFITGLISLFLLRRIGAFSPIEVCLVLFAAFFSLSATGHLIHYQLFGFYWIVPFVLSLFLFLRDTDFRDLILVCVFYILGSTYAVYLAPILLVYALFLGLPLIIVGSRRCGLLYWRFLVQWKNILIVTISGLLLYFLHMRPYLIVMQQNAPVSIDRLILFSATPLSLLQKSDFSYWYQASSTIPGAWESAYFPGYLLLMLGFAFTVQRIWPVFTRRKVDTGVGKAGDLFVAYMIIFLAVSLVLSLGPYLKADVATAYSVPLPYLYLAKVIPGLDRMRAPGRFGMMMGLPLVVMGISFLQHIKLGPRWKNILPAVLLVVLVVESMPKYPVYPFNPDPDGTYHWLAGQISPGSPLVELPLSDKGEGENRVASWQLVGSTIHWARLASGYGAVESPEYRALADSDKQVQLGEKKPAELIALARRYQFEWLLLHKYGYSPPVLEQWLSAAAACIISGNPADNAILIRLASCP